MHRLAVLALPTLGLLAACGDSSSGTPAVTPSGSLTVTAHDFSFDRVAGSVAPGAQVTVTFVNAGKVEHSLTLDSPKGPEVEAGGGKRTTLSFIAPSSGTVTFHCKYHPSQMSGTISVGGSSGAGAGGSSAGSSTTGGYGY